MKKVLRQFGLFLSPIGVLIAVSMLWIFLVKPQVIELIRKQIPKLNDAQSFVEFAVSDVDISFLKLQLSAGRVQVSFKNGMQDLSPLQLRRIRFQIDPFKLMVGQLSLSKIQIDQVNWNFDFKPSARVKSPAIELPLDELFKILPQVPVEQIFIHNSELFLTDQALGLDLVLNIPQLHLQNKNRALSLTIKSLKIHPRNSQQVHVQAELNLSTTLHYDKNDSVLDVPLLTLKILDSSMSLKGKMNNLKNVLQQPEGELNLASELHFDDLRNVGLALFPQKNRMPAITGSAKIDGQMSFKSLADVNGQIAVETKQVSVDHFKLGQAQMRAEIRKNQILINEIEFEHPSAIANLKSIEIEQRPPYQFKVSGHVKQFDLQKLFVSMGLPEIPAGATAVGDAQCSGVIEPEPQLNCEVDTALSDIWVKPSSKAALTIIGLKKANVKGTVQMTSKGLDYQAGLQVGQSVGTSDGHVTFADGFRIHFETENLDFADVETLANLNFKGGLKINGTTAGDTGHGVIDADLVLREGEIEKFKVGRLESKLKYEKSNLTFNQINGLVGKSIYSGTVHFDFDKSNLDAALDMNELYGEDVLYSLQERFGIPFSLGGRGHAHMDINGPFDFWKLKYILKAELNQGQIADEGFEKMVLNLNANGDAIHFDQASMKKTRSRLQLDGDIDTTGKQPFFRLGLKAQPLWIEELDHVAQLAPHLSGQAWIEGTIQGPLENPEVRFNFNAKQMSFENNDYPGSQGLIAINRKNFRFTGQLFGRQIQSDLLWPWNEIDPYALRLQIRDLNPLLLLPLISLPQPSNEFYSRLNADVDLRGTQRSLKTSEGSIRLSDFMLQRGALYLKLSKPSSMQFKNGLSQMDPIELKGESNGLQVNLTNADKNDLRFSIAGDVQLRQFQFLVPFAQTLAGRLQIDSQIAVRGSDFELLGDGELTDGLVGLKSFQQPIENINTPIEFSKSKIILSDLSANLGPSEITGDGQIDIKGPHQINVNVQASTDNIEMTFPEQITTGGRADLRFFGSWLPYTLKVDYKVARGLVEKDFGGDSGGSKTALRSSPYLPPLQIEQQTPSLLLDVAIDLTQGVVVKNQLIEGEAAGKLKVTGTPESPLIAGQIDIKAGSKLTFRSNQFDIQTATIKFPGTLEINPDIYMTANAHVSDYDVNLLVQGIPSKNMVIKPTSQPPLSEPDIFSLLALGLTSSKMDQNLSSQTQQNQTGLEVLAAISNQSVINKKFQEKFGLTVQLAPTVDSTKNIAVPKVVVSKKIQKNVNASYSRPLTGDTQNQEWKLQYLFNPNKSVILNYQNVETNQQDQIRNTNNNNQGILGLDFEYKKEFK